MKRKVATAKKFQIVRLSERIKMLSERLTSLEHAVGHLQAQVMQSPAETKEIEVLDQELLEV